MPRFLTLPMRFLLLSSLLPSTPSASFPWHSTSPLRPVSLTVLPTPSRPSLLLLLSLRTTPSTRPRFTRPTLPTLAHSLDPAVAEEVEEELPLRRPLLPRKRKSRRLLPLLICLVVEMV